MGVRVVQGCYSRTMLSMGDAQAQFSQNEASGFPKLYLIKHTHCCISWDIPIWPYCARIFALFFCLTPSAWRIPSTSWQHVSRGRMAHTPSAVFQVSVASWKWEAAQKQHLGAWPLWHQGPSGVFQHLWGALVACHKARGSCHHQAVPAVATPVLYVGPCDLMLGRVPLVPLFLKGKATPIITHKLRHANTSRAACSSSEQKTQLQRMALGVATCRRSTSGCDS